MGSNLDGNEHENGSTGSMLYERDAESSENLQRRLKSHSTESLWKRTLRFVFPDQRKQERLAMPPLVGYLGTARASKAYDLGDISLTGFSLLTGERWFPGTEMPITFQRTNLPEQNNKDSFTVQATVIRSDAEGVGFSIVLSEEESNAVHGNPLRVKWMTRLEMERFLGQLKAHPGESFQSPLTSAAGTQSGAGTQLNAAFEGGR